MRSTLSPLQSGIERVPRQSLRCIGSFPTLDGVVDYPMSWKDWERDCSWAVRFLESRRIVAGEFVVLVSTGHEAPWYGGILDAINRLGATVCPLEPARFETLRAEMFFTRFPISAVIGLNHELCEAIEQSMTLQKALKGVRNILARPDAVAPLRTAGLTAELIVPIGPALGLPCSQGEVLHVNEAEWQVAANGHRLTVTPRAFRALPPRPLDIEAVVRSASEHRCNCSYGRESFVLRN